jgi:hypothetical protein
MRDIRNHAAIIVSNVNRKQMAKLSGNAHPFSRKSAMKALRTPKDALIQKLKPKYRPG